MDIPSPPDGYQTRSKDGREWRIGTSDDVAWIRDRTPPGLAITSAIPPGFAAYCTIVIPDDRAAHDQAVLRPLVALSADGPWWLGFLDTMGRDDVIFRDAPMVTMYAEWSYVLVEAGPDEAANWRRPTDSWRGNLPDLMFPADRIWLVSRLWDDDWWCVGGPETLIQSYLDDPALEARRVSTEDDATPPGHVSY